MSADRSLSLENLSKAMVEYYAKTVTYYSDIAFATQNWMDKSELAYQFILERLKGSRILEIGCGAASVLATNRLQPSHYWGCDFSSQLLAENRERWPGATFTQLTSDLRLPFPDGYFESVFSVFVLEHCVYPSRFLEECMRVLRPGGQFLLLCPDFLGRGGITSQRSGLSPGTGRMKLRQRKYWDALLTAWDSRLRIPLSCWRLRQLARRSPRFFINLQPVCFTDKFAPDVDAVYLTFEPEIRRYLDQSAEFEFLPQLLVDYLKATKLILMAARRRS